MKKMETFPRPNVSPRRYRQLENIEMSLALLLPDDLGESCIILDMLQNRIRRHLENERMAGHNGEAKPQGLTAEAGEGNIILLKAAGD